MDEFWKQVKNQLTDFHEIPDAFARALIATTRKGREDQVIPEQCTGALSEQFCAANWLAAKYWGWRGGAYTVFSDRTALQDVENYGPAASILIGEPS